MGVFSVVVSSFITSRMDSQEEKTLWCPIHAKSSPTSHRLDIFVTARTRSSSVEIPEFFTRNVIRTGFRG